MIIDIVLLAIALTALILGTFTDIKIREVPDWVNYSVIFAAFGIRAIYSAATFNWMYLLQGLFGFGISAAIAYAMFYTAQWGGGDAKMLMGLGALIGMPFALKPIPLLIIFSINTIIIGAIYGFVWSAALAVKHRRDFLKNFSKAVHEKAILKLRWFVLLSAVILILLVVITVSEYMFKLALIALVFLLYLTFYLFLFIKSVEQTSMFKFVEPEKITEGDWIAEDIIIGKKRICGPKDLGISKAQIKQLIALKKKGKIKKVKVKYGIPFVPSFLIAFIITLLFGAWWLILL